MAPRDYLCALVTFLPFPFSDLDSETHPEMQLELRRIFAVHSDSVRRNSSRMIDHTDLLSFDLILLRLFLKRVEENQMFFVLRSESTNLPRRRGSKQGTDANHPNHAIEGLSLKAEVTAVENLEVKAFSNLRRLRLLQLSHVVLNGSYENFPKGLRWLCWLGFPEESFPINLHLRSLVVMDMQNSNLKRLWDQKKPHESLKELKYLDLSHSIQLTETPDFSYLPNLEKLFLINCQRLAKVHESIKVLQGSLILLNLSGCIKLGELPLELYTLKLLATLILSGCSQLERLDDALGELESLTILKADYTAITQIPSSSDQLKKLKELSLHGCKELWKDRQYTNSDETSQVARLSPLSLNGLEELKTVGVIHMEMCNRIPYSHRERIMQGWAVGANGGVFVPGSSIPEWVNFKNGTRSISFTVPEPTLNSVLVGFTVWTTYVSQQDDVMSAYIPKITLKNQTKGDVWSRNPATDLIRMYREKHIWQGHFSNEDFVLETEDGVEVSVDFGDKVTILETGLTLAYREVIEVPNVQLTEIDDEVDDELVTEIDDELVTDESQRRPPRKMGMGLKTLLGAFGLLAFIVVLGKHGRPLRRHNHLRRNKVEKDKEKNATLPIFSFLDY
ncbi:hypothetical protein IGI04_004673 [Brassica rapa subsp. trilocularis]|uniref:Malectin-like domain-containing protein n=1 Tax=Brassica rapa subsp. trilocularis TaxID=1813537 RepID=A0ABQ7NBS2_BRACM|nr:hypothetical protein IGI04_004673 [Brassica rapa subsp. trilocularis]